MTKRLRRRTFAHMIKQEIAWFDEEDNNTGGLTTKLATDATLVQGMLGARLASMLQSSVSMIAGLVIAFLAGWLMTLVVLACVPFIMLAGALQMKTLKGKL